MKVFFSLLASLCLAGLIVGSGNSLELEGHGGFYRYDKALARGFQADDSPVFGLRFGSAARRIFSGETTVAYGPADDMKIILLMGNILLNVSIGDAVPFLTLGTGTTIFVPDRVDENLDTETRFTMNYGGGLRYFVRDSIALRCDARDNVVFDLDFGPGQGGGGGGGISVGTIHNLVVGGGVSVLF